MNKEIEEKLLSFDYENLKIPPTLIFTFTLSTLSTIKTGLLQELFLKDGSKILNIQELLILIHLLQQKKHFLQEKF